MTVSIGDLLKSLTLIWTLLFLQITQISAVKFGSIGDISTEKENKYAEMSDKALLWGPYRPNVYVGMRPRVPKGLMLGLSWFGANDYSQIRQVRHQCVIEDEMGKFGWTEYDPRLGGKGVIEDKNLGLTMNIRLVKGGGGENWALNIHGEPENPKAINTLMLYTGVEGENDVMMLKTKKKSPELVAGHNLELVGNCESIGGVFLTSITETGEGINKHLKLPKLKDAKRDPSETHHMSLVVPHENMWKAKDIFQVLLEENIRSLENITELQKIHPAEISQLVNPGMEGGNMHLIEKTFVGAFDLTIIFNMLETEDPIRLEDFDRRSEAVSTAIKKKFAMKMQLASPFNKGEYLGFGEEFLSQLMGGIGYFYGDQLVDRKANLDEPGVALKGEPEGPYSLFSCVPSRTFFPRGFYWDEGFQLIPVLNYDPDLALEILKSWFSLIDNDGWIAREQILGPEARSRVPEEFVVQNPNIANPPTMMMLFSEILDLANNQESAGIAAGEQQMALEKGAEGGESSENSQVSLGDVHLKDPELLGSYAREIYPKLQKHYEWFRRTQRAEVDEIGEKCKHKAELYRWKGRSEDHCLPSGLDDYPRCPMESPELDVDLMSWMAVMARSISSIAKLLGRTQDYNRYTRQLKDITENIEDCFWSPHNESYSDIALDDDEEEAFECHPGYVTLMPFVHRLIPASSPHLMRVIEDLRDPEKLWSPYGIRSLSKDDANFHTGEDYWRGHIWININYLVLDALKYYGQHPDTSKEVKTLASAVYSELRQNIVQNVYKEYKQTGNAWEQYNEKTGAGQRTRHFLGWTSLVVMMMKMPAEI